MRPHTPINPHRPYTADEAAEFLGIHRDSVYRIPVRHLPRSKVGPRRGRTRFMGSDLIAYFERMTLG